MGLRFEGDLLQLHLVDHAAGLRGDRASAFQNAVDAEDRLVSRPLPIHHPAHSLEEDPKRVGAAFVHQRARHDHVVHKMAGQKPVVRMDVGFGADDAHAETAARRVQLRHSVDQPHSAAGEAQAFGGTDAGERRSERRGQIAPAERVHGFIVVGFPDHGNQFRRFHRSRRDVSFRLR